MTSLAASARPSGSSGTPPSRGLVFGLVGAGALCGAFGLALDALTLTLLQTLAAGLAATAFLGLTLWRYKWAVSVAFLLMGFQLVEPGPVDFALVAVIAVGLVTGRMDPRGVPLWVAASMGAFIALNLLAFMEAVKPGRAAFYLGVTLYLFALGLWTASYVTTPERARTILSCLVAVATFSAVFGSLTLFVHLPVFSAASDGQRATALFDDPNIYGPFLASVSLLVLQELLEPRVLRWGRPLLGLTFAIITIGSFLSYSRASWLNWAVGATVLIAVLPLRRGGTGRALVLALILLTGVGATAATVVLTGQADFVQQRAQYQTYDNERFGAQKLGIEFAESKPLGIGPGQFEELSPVSAHSTYVRAGAEEGIGGFAIIITLFFGTLLIAAKNVVLGRDTAGIGSLGLLAVWAGMLANSVFIDTLHWRHIFVFAGLIWAGSLAAPAVSQASSRAGVRSPM